MADPKVSVTMTLGYKDTDFTRKMKFDNVATGALADVKTKIKAVNASLKAGTDGGLGDFFRADTYAAGASATIGTFSEITAAQVDTSIINVIDLS